MGQKYGVEWWILVAGAVIIVGIILMALFAGAIAPFSPYDQNTGPQLAPPSEAHLMGTDNLQRDVFSRIIFGAPGITILWKYIFPNVIATTAVVFTMNVGDAIMIEAALTYLGLGLPPSVVDWGMDLAMGKKFLPSGQWWLITFPGAMISLLAVGFTMLGEGLSEILNPRLLER
ncbi:MAG: ABC transporter permease subunit [Desulfobacterales bacterium]